MTTPQNPQSPGEEPPQWGPPPGQGGPPPQGGPPGQGGPPPGQYGPPPGQAGQPPWSGQQPPQGYAPPTGPGAYQAGPVGAPAKPNKTRNLIGIIVLVVLLGGLGIFAYLQNKDSVVNAEEGDCVQVNSSVDFDVVDCSAAEAQYKVVSVVDDVSSSSICELDADVDYAIEISGDTNKSLCLQTWLQVGDCVASDGSWAECGSATSSYEVIEVVENTQDDTQCPDTTAFVRVYAGENNVICLAEPA